MRIRTIILILAIIQASTAFTQTQWVQPGAEWHYDYITVDRAGSWTWTYEKDTVINSISCQMLESTGYELNYNTGGIVKRPHLKKNFVYNSGDTIFWYVNGKFEILYNFAAYVGYTWDLGLDSSANCERPVVTVDSIKNKIIDGKILRYYYTSVPQTSAYFYNHMIERIGGLNTLFPAKDDWCDTTYMTIPEHPGYQLHCYKDDVNGRIDTTNIAWVHQCDDIYYAGIEDFRRHAISIGPNPASDFLTVYGTNDVKYTVYDIQGKPHFSGQTSSEIDLSILNPGIYILKLALNDGVRNYRFVKQ